MSRKPSDRPPSSPKRPKKTPAKRVAREAQPANDDELYEAGDIATPERIRDDENEY